MQTENFSFNISLSVLNHLGRNLYRSFLTIIGEAISNSWDADARNVWITYDKDDSFLIIEDDGVGMSSDDFQDKFLKVGYSKRANGKSHSQYGRPYIGRKGIGKLALLSCASEITIISKTEKTPYIGGVINNVDLDQAITDDINANEYKLKQFDFSKFRAYLKNNQHGTIIYFENINSKVRSSIEALRKNIALYFRFSLIDSNFNIFLNDEKISIDDLDDLLSKTQFLWNINNINDPYVNKMVELFTQKENEIGNIDIDDEVKGFIASVRKPRNLSILGTGERTSIDLFVNGRIRERNILRHIPTSRLVESYLYGQIHFNTLEDEKDRFTSSREGVVSNDDKFRDLLSLLQTKIIPRVLNEWDIWRRKHKDSGDPDNTNISPKERKAEEFFNEASKEFVKSTGTENISLISEWVGQLSEDAKFNFISYADCFISENLIREFIKKQEIVLSVEAERDIRDYKSKENDSKTRGNVSIELRKRPEDVSYLDMDGLANLVDKTGTENDLAHDAKAYKPIRNALMHTALLTDEAKRRLHTVYENIKGRLNIIFNELRTP